MFLIIEQVNWYDRMGTYIRGAIALADFGIRLFACRLYNHDYLWFSSNEISKLSVTLPLLHNYALTYSLGDYSYGISRDSVPHYLEDLSHISLYATPAVTNTWISTRLTYNAVNSLTLRTDDAPRGINSPDLGWRNYLDPVFSSVNSASEFTGFICYLFTFAGQQPKGVTRLGKKNGVIRVKWEEIEKPLAIFKSEPVSPTHPLNPLDVSGELITYEPVSIPPHLLLRTAELRNDWFIFSAKHRIHVPRRVLEKCQS
ncbi:MAG: type I-D CRISPR-associated protein Cas5/Csc1 [Desulfitobacteriaceae bacterium]